MSKFIASVGKRCVACGACQKGCPRNAIEIKQGIQAVVNQDLCVGCGLCVSICPAGVLEKVERAKI